MQGARPQHFSARVAALAAVAPLVLAGCGTGGASTRRQTLGADMPLHLEDELAEAKVVGCEPPREILQRVAWSFREPQPEWHTVSGPEVGAASLSHAGDALRVTLGEADRIRGGDGVAGLIAVDLPGWRRDEWGEVLVEARSDGVQWLQPAFNLGTRADPHDAEGRQLPYLYAGEGTMVIRDGRAHTYRLRADWSDPAFGPWQEPWRQLVLTLWAPEPATFEILSVTVVPKGERYAGTGAGVRSEIREQDRRRALFVHAPGRLEYSVRLPTGARLDTGLGVLQSNRPVGFRVAVLLPEGGERVVLDETLSDSERWTTRSVDLSAFAGRTVELALEARSEAEGAVGFWAAPTLSGVARPGAPNVVFYVIDGGGADLMSVYGYNRRTTPNLERIAAQGAVFEHAYSNAAWTKPSTASFMTSLQQSVLGGFPALHDPIPEGAVTMAEHFHRAGYQTAAFTSNPWAGSLSGLERGADLFHEKGFAHDSASSVGLHRAFWSWRADYPGGPFWVHFQTTDVHEPHRPVAPFAGTYVSPDRSRRFHEWWQRINLWEADAAQAMAVVKDPRNTLAGLYRERLEAIGVEPREFFDIQRGLYDETMAHQDHQLGRFVERLQAAGEWDNTLLVVAADHGHPAGSFSRFGRELFDPPPPDSEGALLDSYRTRVPLIFVWPGRITAGQRLSPAVSMIDVLPTLLDLAGLPAPDVMQGQSLAPLLLGRPGWEPRPVILEQLQPVPGHDVLVGHIEIIDGRWGASLEIWPESLAGAADVRPVGNQRAARPHRPGEIPPLVLYDVWDDPFATRNVNERHPELVEKYTKLLREQWRAHQALAGHFRSDGGSALTPDQLETLRDLGYIQ